MSWWKWKGWLKTQHSENEDHGIQPTTSWQIDGETVAEFIFRGSKITADDDCSYEIKRRLLLGRKVITNLDRTLKNRHYFANKGPSSQSYGFSSGHVWMWELDYKEIWALKNWCFWTVVLEKTLESPLDWKEIKPVNPKGNQSWIFIGRTDAKAETPILWPPAVKNWLTGKDSDAEKDWRQEEKQMTEDEMVGWHHWLDGHEFEQALWVGDGQGSLAWLQFMGVTKSWTWLSNSTELISEPQQVRQCQWFLLAAIKVGGKVEPCKALKLVFIFF